jgi:hypothetical protein
LSAPTHVQAETESGLAHHRLRGRVGRKFAANAACGICAAIPNPELCRIDLADVVLALSSRLTLLSDSA